MTAADQNGRILIKDALVLRYLMTVQRNFRGICSFLKANTNKLDSFGYFRSLFKKF